MRNLRHLIKKLENKLGFRKKKMVAFVLRHRSSDEEFDAAKEKLLKEYLKTHEEPAWSLTFGTYADIKDHWLEHEL